MRPLLIRLAILATAGALVAAPRVAPAQDGVRVIVNPATPASELTRDQVSRLFLKKVRHWSGGVPVAPVDLDDDSPTRAAFSRAVHRRSVDLIRQYWEQQIFSGRNVPPPDKATDAAVVAFVRTTPGAIGYVSPDADVRGVKVVEIRAN